MEYKTKNNRKYMFGLIVLLAVATATTYAWTVTENTDEKTEILSVTTADGVDISNYKSRPIGKGKIEIKFDIEAQPTTACDISFYNVDGIVDVSGFTALKWEFDAASDGSYVELTLGNAPTEDDTNDIWTIPKAGLTAAGTVRITFTNSEIYKSFGAADKAYAGVFIATY